MIATPRRRESSRCSAARLRRGRSQRARSSRAGCRPSGSWARLCPQSMATGPPPLCTPDGYTIMLGFTGTLDIAPSLYPHAGYDPRKDFAPVGRVGVACRPFAVDVGV
jgi:hypothetical protein